jgi:hypothetical protein
MNVAKRMFQASEFAATQWGTVEEKAKFAQWFVRFVAKDFPPSMWHKTKYRRLCNMFHFIAHYNAGGFWDEKFSTLERQWEFVKDCLRGPHYGDPRYTWSDVEKALASWLFEEGVETVLRAKVEAQQEAAERSEFHRLKEKYGA